MDKCERQKHQPRRKKQSFSSSLLDAIYRSIDDSKGLKEEQVGDFLFHGRNNVAKVEEEIENHRRAIMIEKWMDNYNSITPRHFASNSGSSTDLSMFLSSEIESSSLFTGQKLNQSRNLILERPCKISPLETDRKGGFVRTKSKIFRESKKVKEPYSPGAKIANFLNSIFSPRNLKKSSGIEERNSVRKSKSMKLKDKTTCSLASRSCLSRTMYLRANKSKKSVKFSSVSNTIVEDNVGNNFIKKNKDIFRDYDGKNVQKHEYRDLYEDDSDVDDKSCASSDLFELENIGRVGIRSYEEDLPVYGTTSLKMNKAFASGLVM